MRYETWYIQKSDHDLDQTFIPGTYRVPET